MLCNWRFSLVCAVWYDLTLLLQQFILHTKQFFIHVANYWLLLCSRVDYMGHYIGDVVRYIVLCGSSTACCSIPASLLNDMSALQTFEIQRYDWSVIRDDGVLRGRKHWRYIAGYVFNSLFKLNETCSLM